MELSIEQVTLEVSGERADAVSVRPARVTTPLPGIVLVQEAFGLDPFVRDVAGRLATAGYAVIAPALFSLGGTPPALADDRVALAKSFLDSIPQTAWFDPAERAEALAKWGERSRLIGETLSLLLAPERPWDRYVSILRAGRAHLAEGTSKGQRVGVLGFCLGGALSLRLACADPEIAASVVFYGVSPPAEQLATLRCPVLGLYAESDPRITPAVPELARTIAERGGWFEHHVYPGTRHAFFNDTRPSYDVDASRDSWARALSFLAASLGDRG